MGPGHGLQLYFKQPRGVGVKWVKPRQFQNLQPVPLPVARGIGRTVEPVRADPQPRGDICDVTIVKIGSQEKASRRPEIPDADQKADLAGHGLHIIGRGPDRDRQIEDTPALNAGQLWWTVEQHLLGLVEDFMRGTGVWFLEGVGDSRPTVCYVRKPAF